MGAPLEELVHDSLEPIIIVAILCSVGFVLASDRVGILSNVLARRTLSKLVVTVFLPCIIFTQLGKGISLEKLKEWWFIPVNVLLASLLGCTLGTFVSLIIKPPSKYFKFTIVMIGIGNIGNIPLVLIATICNGNNNLFGPPDQCNANGSAYISFGQWVGALMVYTFVYRMLEQPIDDQLSYASIPLINDFEREHSCWLSKQTHRVKKGVRKLLFKYIRIQDVLQPPVVASLLAMLLGSIPITKSALFGNGGLLRPLTAAMGLMGQAMITCILLVLGGNLSCGPGASELDLKTTLTIVLTRLLVVPLIGIGVVHHALKLKIIPLEDKMFQFVLLLQHSMPSSILVGSVTSLIGFGETEASAILFWEHIAAVVSLPCWLALHMYILFP